MPSNHFKMRVVEGTPKHLSRRGQLEGFTYLMINFEFICNYACLKCFNRGNKNFMVSSKPFLELEERMELIHQAKDMGGKVAVFAGAGEPTIHPDIRTLVSLSKSLDMIPIVYSNGSAINDDWCKFYKDNGAVLVFSFDSLDPRSYAIQAGWKNPNSIQTRLKHGLVLKNIDDAIEAYQGIRHEEEGLDVLSVAVNTTVSDINAHEVQAIKDRFGKGAYFICNPLAVIGNAARHPNLKVLMPSGEDPKIKYAQLIKETSESGGPLTLGTDGICGYSKLGVAVSPNGDYMTCAYTRETNRLLSNIREISLKKAFEYKQYMEGVHYLKHGVSPCLVRSISFQEYLGSLTSQQGIFCCYGRGIGYKH